MPTFLHVGCGQKRRAQSTRGFAGQGWTEVTLDIDPEVRPDIVASITDMAGAQSGAMDGLFSSHNIEHLYPDEVTIALREFARVLKPDGFAVVTCPDLQSVAALVAQGRLMEPAYVSPSGPIAPIDILYGHRDSLAAGHRFMAHRTGFTGASLTAALRESGFASVIVRQRPRFFDLWALATPIHASAERLRALAAEHFPLER